MCVLWSRYQVDCTMANLNMTMMISQPQLHISKVNTTSQLDHHLNNNNYKNQKN